MEGQKTRDQVWKEWWAISRLLKTQDPARALLPDGAAIEKSESPDFSCMIGDALSHIEVTEATDPGDQREMAMQRTLAGSARPGEFGGRSFDPDDDSVVDAIEEDIRAAVERKAGKPYATRDCMLLVYQNSNAWTMLPEPLFSLVGRFRPYGDDLPFYAVAVLLSDDRLMEWRPEVVRLTAPRP